ncbi:MAG: anthranilate synthase component I, partial [Candidatus Stahlbacteria bacterium]|nr:anthranilate synthase component I [Candidatus Stahlbacteria bacterium]
MSKIYFPDIEKFKQKAKKWNLIPVYREILADMETPVSAFYKMDNGKYGFLLEGVEKGETIGRFSFLGTNPYGVFKNKGKEVEIIRNSTSERKTLTYSNPLSFLKKEMRKFKIAQDKKLPSFSGGAVGYIGYDMARNFEKLPETCKDKLHLPDAMFMLCNSFLIFDHLKRKIKVVHNAEIKNNPEIAYNKAIYEIESIISLLEKPISEKTREVIQKTKDKRGQVKSNFTKTEFMNIVKTAKEHIIKGDIIQVVLSQRFTTKANIHPFCIYRALRSINPSPYMFYLKFDDFHLIGSSPEILVTKTGKEVRIKPIAGTRPREKTLQGDNRLAQELLNDPKEKAEHIMLVDLGRNDIGRVCKFGTVRVNELMAIEKYSHVMHIVSDVTGELAKGKDSFDILRACFPAGTVTGAPKIRAMEIIDKLEKSQRGPYAGGVGYFSFTGNMDLGIAIRCIAMKGKNLFIQAGAGIVA